ncbi:MULTISPECIES: alpha/beta hydrolase [Pseudomonadota]|jgi:acetyl esterase/lipase|uniref:alpha/beta hydrolase n=2 Tax=Pseudomonadota TaxID=1224 RepID=UPI00076A75C5|nr:MULTISPECIES: alpha/beta hydrolase [Pseudomonadota]MAF60594.1 alpha/beta hydrolase [Blastomonas sp.]|tara:strand:+ start:184861 stop:185766 length:906 start_codon:yes stop_codon:yes gene_type:complete
MKRGTKLGLGVVFAAVAGLGLVAATTSPPLLLSQLDAAMGGGKGARLVTQGVRFGSHGQTLDIWRAEGASNGDKRPVLIFWHGGGWVKGARADYAFAGRAFARQGFVVVIPDYRKVPEVRFPAFVQDGAEAVAWVRDNIARFGGDPQRIAFSGHSAGAHTAVLLALDPRWLKAAEVDPGIVKAVLGLSGPYDFYPFTTKRSIDAMSHYPDPKLTQPIEQARADAPPMLLVTSTRDETVRPRNAINLSKRLKALGALAELINYRGLDHEEVVMALSVPFRSKGPVLQDSVAFLNRHLGKEAD